MNDTTEAVAAIRQRAEAVKARAERATPGPWASQRGTFHLFVKPDGKHSMFTVCRVHEVHVEGKWTPEANVEFIAAARSDVPQLADDVLALAEALEVVERAATRMPGDLTPDDTWRQQIQHVARAALASRAAQGGDDGR